MTTEETICTICHNIVPKEDRVCKGCGAIALHPQAQPIIDTAVKPQTGIGGTTGLALALGANTLLQWLVWVFYAVLFIAMMLNKTDSIAGVYINSIQTSNAIAAIVFVPLAFLLSLIRPVRYVGGTLLLFAASMMTFSLACMSAWLIYSAWGRIGVLIGTLFIGYGIIAAAILADVFSSHWWLLIETIGSGIMILIARFSGTALITARAHEIDGEIVEEIVNRKAGINGAGFLLAIDVVLVVLGYLGAKYAH